MSLKKSSWLLLATLIALSACTQEKQNEISRNIQNWTGTWRFHRGFAA